MAEERFCGQGPREEVAAAICRKDSEQSIGGVDVEALQIPDPNQIPQRVRREVYRRLPRQDQRDTESLRSPAGLPRLEGRGASTAVYQQRKDAEWRQRSNPCQELGSAVVGRTEEAWKKVAPFPEVGPFGFCIDTARTDLEASVWPLSPVLLYEILTRDRFDRDAYEEQHGP